MDISSSSHGRPLKSLQVPAKRATYEVQNTTEHHGVSASRSKSMDSSSSARFACPFLLANPHKVEANAICARNSWPTIPRLKEHLYRRHAQRHPSCARCARSFEKEKELDEHLRAETPCKISNSSKQSSQSISPSQMYRLRRRKGQYTGSEVKKWFDIWDLLFPDIPRPRSPYLHAGDGMCGWGLRVMDNLQDSIERRVSSTVRVKLEERDCEIKNRTEDQESLECLITACVGSAFEEYKSYADPQREGITEMSGVSQEDQDTLDAHKYQENAVTEATTSRIDTLSSSNSTLRTATSEYNDGNTRPEQLSVINDPCITRSPEHMGMVDAYPLPSTWLLAFSTSRMGSQFPQEHLLLPEATSTQYGECQFLSPDPAFCCDDIYDASREAADAGWNGRSTSIYQM